MQNFDCQAFMASVRRAVNEYDAGLPDLTSLFTLVRMSGKEFVSIAYKIILRRNADPQALQRYVPKSEHLFGRLLILISLLLSPERPELPSIVRRLSLKLRYCVRLIRNH